MPSFLPYPLTEEGFLQMESEAMERRMRMIFSHLAGGNEESVANHIFPMVISLSWCISHIKCILGLLNWCWGIADSVEFLQYWSGCFALSWFIWFGCVWMFLFQYLHLGVVILSSFLYYIIAVVWLCPKWIQTSIFRVNVKETILV